MKIHGMTVLGKTRFVIAARRDVLFISPDRPQPRGFYVTETFKDGWYLDLNLASTPDLARAATFKTAEKAAEWLKSARLTDKRSRRELRDYGTEAPITVGEAFQIEEIVTLVRATYTATGKDTTFDGRR
jgi:hypothetical protein